ncbi:hypothetical protein P3X46_032539 [Hevea brasiliensis]|uniref:Morc S5 domain-containing protein n=1 Tax=Hevea brasiliensis TaxID=3981 RepID=A0ABQ9KDK8_HEVBR|nr:hypothetical protein P3X46_032539 [Hevea brasiliensis]
MSFPVLDMIDLCSDDELRELGVIGGSSEKPKDQGGSLDDSSHPVGPSSLPPPPISRQFWKAGDYEVDEINHLHVHPMFLHSNATSHKWVFGAIAELVDNAIDEIQNAVTFVDMNKMSNPWEALLIQGAFTCSPHCFGGMDHEEIRCCLSFGFSKKMKYGNSFKASTMRLGADVIVFSRHGKMRFEICNAINSKCWTPILYILRSVGHEKIIIQWWFDDIGDHGTKIVLYNLWLNDDGDMELDFDSNIENYFIPLLSFSDIRISGDPKLFQVGDLPKPIFQQHIANVYHYSLRQHNLADDLKFPEFILYKPQTGVKNETVVITTIGFLKEAPDVNIHGFNIYHLNRLSNFGVFMAKCFFFTCSGISFFVFWQPFWRVLKNTTNSVGGGIVGVLEANYIEPTHNKQDFENLKQMTIEYWHLHCELIGYQGEKSSSALPSEERHYSGTGTKEGLNRKRKGPFPPVAQECAQAYAADTWHIMEDQPYSRSKHQVQGEKASLIMQQNKKLRLQISELEKNMEGFHLKVEQLRRELIEVQHECARLLAESKSMDMINEGRYVMGH